MNRALVLSIASALAACATSPHDPAIDPPVDPPVDPPIDPPQGRTVTVTLDDLRPGDRVTTSRLRNSDAPGEQTVISDGSPITLTGTDQDIFVATITDADGVLRATHSMNAHCSLANARRLDVPRDYATIQAAVDAAEPGDTVRVAAGTYTESVKLRSGVCLLGMGAKHTILDAQFEGRTLVDLTNAPGSLVAGFTIKNTRPKPQPSCGNEDVFTCSGNWYAAGVYLGTEGALGWEN